MAVPLDPRFYAGGGEADNPSGAGERLGPPWEGVEGAHVPVIFTVETPGEGSVQFDVIEADAAAPGDSDESLRRVLEDWAKQAVK